MTDEQQRIMKLLVEIDYEKHQIDEKIQSHTGNNSDLIEMLVIKGGVVGKIKVLHDLMSKVDIK